MPSFEKLESADDQIFFLRNSGVGAKEVYPFAPLLQSQRIRQRNPMEKGAKFVVTVLTFSKDSQDEIDFSGRLESK
jgi:hypothetical protein